MSTLQDVTTPLVVPVMEREQATSPSQFELTKSLKPLASLKLSVLLFALGIFLVLAGTLAQVESDIWEVVSGYFRCWLAWIPLQVFFPKTWFPELQNIPGGFWFPGGWMIGGLMTVNLLTAHAIRFKIQAKGQQMWWGLLVTFVGILLTWVVIEFGTARDAIYETGNFSASFYWNLFCYSLLLPTIGCGVAAWKYADVKQKKVEFGTYSILAFLFGALSIYLIISGDALRLNNSAMRILWQLIQATFAGAVLLGGCLLLFKKRAGIVLLHAGVLLLMSNELVVHQLHEEANIILSEGETTNFVRDIRTSEVAFVDRSGTDKDRQTVIPQPLLTAALKDQTVIDHDQLPVKVKVREFFQNADLQPRQQSDANPATVGLGKTHTIVPLRKSAGTDSSADYPAAYLDLMDKQSGEVLETVLVSAVASSIDRADKLKLAGKEYEIALRFKHIYKPYSIHLIDVRKDDYIGTSTPMNYSSEIRLVDESRNEDRQIKIWMNNPLRFAGETFYQSGYQKVGEKEVTTLQVVTNEGWMIPYVACMIVAVGMLYQFGVSLMRFLDRVAYGRVQLDSESTAETGRASGWMREIRLWSPAAILVCLFGYWLYGLSKPTPPAAGEYDLAAFGRIPVVYQGRVKPLDTLARNSVRVLSNRETVRTEPAYEKSDGEPAEKAKAETLPAIQWLLELATGSQLAMQRPVIRIDNDEVLSTMKLERRKSHRYSLDEIEPQIPQLVSTAKEARELQAKQPEALSVYQRKVLDLEQKLGLVDLVTLSFMSPPIDPAAGNVREQLQFAISAVRRLDERQPPLLIPPVPELSKKLDQELQRNDWESYSKAFLMDVLYVGGFQVEANPFSSKFAEIILAYQNQDAEEFNQQVKAYHQLLKQESIPEVDSEMLAYESRFNAFAPFFWPAFIYIFAFLLAKFSWMLPSYGTTLNRAAWALILLTFVVHTWALYARLQISGRPPVTNLYSSAVFIGWGVVLFGLILEVIFKRGIGNVLASSAGFAALWIAHGLAGDGDTFVVLQAVLDTQFWLSTHVVCITLGYAATFAAGLLGVIYITRRNPLALLCVLAAVGGAVALQGNEQIPLLLKNLGPYLLAIPAALIPMYFLYGQPQIKLPEVLEKNLARMIYGTLCFALWFSFVGTVLGGLWADDSWGRFWGWDPKENGALIIVLWNALVLHARWDRMIQERGLALLAVAGNITTSWSWFGVNELGVGLHSYGFTEGVLFYLSLFVLSQLTLIVIGAWGGSRARTVSV